MPDTYKYQYGGGDSTIGLLKSQYNNRLSAWQEQLTGAKSALDKQQGTIDTFVIPDAKGTAEEKGAFQKIWDEQDKIAVTVPYKDRTGVHGYIPKSAWKDFSNAVASSEGLRNRTSINAPLAEDVPGYSEKLQEIQEAYVTHGDAYTEYIDSGDDSAYGEPGYSIHHDPAEALWKDLNQITTDAGYTVRFTSGFGQKSAGLADRLTQSYNDLNTNNQGSFRVSGSDEYRALYYGMGDVLTDVYNQYSNELRTSFLSEKDKAVKEITPYWDEYNTAQASYDSEAALRDKKREGVHKTQSLLFG